MKKTNLGGFAISVDALLATMLALGVLTFAGIGLQVSSEDTSALLANIKQATDGAFLALDNTGIISKELVDQFEANPALNIKQEAEKMLPQSVALRVEVKEFRPKDLEKCRETQDFEDCFGEEENSFVSGDQPPSDREIIHGRRLAITRSTGTESDLGTECIVIQEELEEKKPLNPMFLEPEKENEKLFFAGELEKTLSTEIIAANPSGVAYDKISCCDNPTNPQEDEIIKVTMKLRDSSRDPVAIVLAMDESGSMKTYDILKQENPSTVFNDGSCEGGACLTDSDNCPKNNSEHTNWQLLGSFTLDDDYLNRFHDIDITGEEWLRLDLSRTEYSTQTCGRIPKLKVVSPDGTSWYLTHSQTSSPYYYVRFLKEIMEPYNTGDKVWSIYGWANKPYSASVNHRFRGQRAAINTIAALSGGTGTGSGAECSPDTATFVKIGEVTMPFLHSNQLFYYLYGGMTYDDTYDDTISDCRPHLYFRESTGAFTSNIRRCPASGWCTASGSYSPAAGDTIEFWGWSDDEIALSAISLSYYVADNEVGGRPFLPSLTIDTSANGCNNDPCLITESTCKDKTGWFDDTYSGPGDVDVYTVEEGENFGGVNIRIWSDNYEGECTSTNGIHSSHRGPVYRVRKPDQTIYTGYITGFYCSSGYCSSTLEEDPNLDTGDYELEGWADEETTTTVKWYIRRIDAARNAAKDFINRGDWKTLDRFGNVSFDDTIVDAEDVIFLTSDKGTVINALDALSPDGGTATAPAIVKATEVLEDAETDSKFIIILTDGRANVCTSTPPYSECPSTPNNCCEAQAVKDAADAAAAARAEGITVYLIGFADSSLIGDYEEDLKELVLDKDDPRFSAECASGDFQYCGKYYFAADEEDLEEMYEKIAGEIGERFGAVNIEVPFPDGIELLETEPQIFGVWSDEENDFWSAQEPGDQGSLVWNETERMLTLPENRSIYNALDKWFAMQFQVIIPCAGSYCDTNNVVFPPNEGGAGPVRIIDYADQSVNLWAEDAGGEYCTPDDWPGDQYCRDKYLKLPYLYKDLAIMFNSGRIDGGGTYIELNIANTGYKDIAMEEDTSELEIKFENESGLLLATCTPPGCRILGHDKQDQLGGITTDSTIPPFLELYDVTLCEPETGTCPYSTGSPPPATDTEINIEDLFLSGSGTIKATINPNKVISECSKNNEGYIYCGTSQFKFFTIDYYAWVE